MDQTDKSSEVAAAVAQLDRISRRLRRECPWDREQDACSIVPHTIEEAYELADAVCSGDTAKMLDELGDVLFQVIFLSLLLEEAGEGSLDQVAEHCIEKLVRRHPHVFGEEKVESAKEVLKNWDRIKLSEKGDERAVFDDLPKLLPALLYARKAQRRAAGHGFDWADIAGPLEKVHEELSELEDAIGTADGKLDESKDPGGSIYWEVGDLLFATVNVARKHHVDPEIALRESCNRFMQRVNKAEKEAEKDGKAWRELDLDEQERYYRKAKGQSRDE